MFSSIFFIVSDLFLTYFHAYFKRVDLSAFPIINGLCSMGNFSYILLEALVDVFMDCEYACERF